MARATIVWAYDQNRFVRHILEVPSGLACGCFCPSCDARLEAVNSQNPAWVKRPHFRHHAAPELPDCAMRAFLAGAAKILTSLRQITLPTHTVTKEARSASGQVFKGSVSVAAAPMVISSIDIVDETDAILTLDNGQQVRVRLIGHSLQQTNPSSQTQMGEVIIDVSSESLQDVDPAVLRDHISLASASRWCRHPDEERLAAQAQSAADKIRDQHEAAEKRFFSEHPAKRPVMTTSTPAASIPRSMHISAGDIQTTLKKQASREKPMHCCWTTSRPDSRLWEPMVPTWEAIFGNQFMEVLDAGLTGFDLRRDATEVLAETSLNLGFSKNAIFGMWQAARIAERLP